MKIVCFSAMTAAEFHNASILPPKIGWMACHFSSYGTGLSNLPARLPEGSLLIVNDRTPVCGHDASLIFRQLQQCVQHFQCSAVLLDFQRPGAEAIAEAAAGLPCPVAVTPAYAGSLNCAVFLPPPPPTVPLCAHIAPWQGRTLWLEAALERSRIRITSDGAQAFDGADFPCPHTDALLHCRYGMELGEQYIDFHLQRDKAQLSALLEEAASLGIEVFVGLYQQLGDFSAHAEAQATARCQ